jgi:hypothetical protein
MLTFSDWSAGNFAHRSAFGCRHSRHSHAESDHTQIHGVERRKAGCGSAPSGRTAISMSCAASAHRAG